MEEQLIKKIKGIMMGIKTGSKSPADIGVWLNKLQKINEPMYQELLGEYIQIKKAYDAKK
jgi:hypothetical protein